MGMTLGRQLIDPIRNFVEPYLREVRGSQRTQKRRRAPGPVRTHANPRWRFQDYANCTSVGESTAIFPNGVWEGCWDEESNDYLARSGPFFKLLLPLRAAALPASPRMTVAHAPPRARRRRRGRAC